MNEEMMSAADLLDQIAGAAPSEAPIYEDLPPGVWCIGKTATEENGKAAPEVRTFDSKKDIDPETGEAMKVRMFNVGLLCLGGESKLDSQKHGNKTCFFSAFLNPGERELEHDDQKFISGRLTGFLNACYSPGVGYEFASKEEAPQRTAARWVHTISELKKVQQQEEITPEQYKGDKARFIAGLAVAGLKESSKLVLFKTTARKRNDTGETRIEVGQIEDYTPENCKKRKVAMFAAQQGMDY